MYVGLHFFSLVFLPGVKPSAFIHFVDNVYRASSTLLEAKGILYCFSPLFQCSLFTRFKLRFKCSQIVSCSFRNVL